MRAAATTFACLAAVALAASGAGVPAAEAVIPPPVTLDGPSSDIVELGGVAMAQDGTGGLVYRKRAENRLHIFAARFVDGTWQPPQRVDAGQRFDSSWPAVGAGDGGRLVVTWVQEFGAGDRMFSSSLQPGSRRFEPPVPVDLNVGDSALGTFPSLSMNRGGQAFLTYRVISDANPATASPQTVLGEIRLARFNGQLWSTFGSPLNRNPAAPQRQPNTENGPKIGTDVQGNAVLAWQEADDDLIDRVWARRIFPNDVGVVLPVSPREWGGRPLRAPADAFSLDVSGFGAAAVAFRQQAGTASALARPRVMVATSPEVFTDGAARFAEARLADGGGEPGPAGPLGPARISVTPEGGFGTGFANANAGMLVEGGAGSVGAAEPLGSSGGSPETAVQLAESGAAALALSVNGARSGTVLVRERRADGVSTDQQVFAARGGTVIRLLSAGSKLGDGLFAFQQGTGAFAQIAAATVDAPPEVFAVQTPLSFTRERRVNVSWDASANAIGGVSYSVTVDDDTIAEGLRTRRAVVDTSDLEDGVRTVQVVATDSAGQETTSNASELRLDRRAPRVRVSRRGRVVLVRVADGPKGRVNGLAAGSTRVTTGDGKRLRGAGTLRVRYRRSGRFRLTVSVRDKGGNRAQLRRTVRVP